VNPFVENLKRNLLSKERWVSICKEFEKKSHDKSNQHISYKSYQTRLDVGLEGLRTLEFVGHSLPIKLTMLTTYLLEFLNFH
jgi:hypothetical protein